MRNSDFFKKTPVKVISAIVLFFVFTGLISVAITHPFQTIYARGNHYTTLFVGASETKWGVDPNIIDELTGSNSYVLATASATIEAKHEMLKSAIDQQNLDTAVIEISYFSLCRNMSTLEMDKKVLYYARVAGFKNQFDLASRKFSFWEDEYDQLYAEELFEGMNAWKHIVKGDYPRYKTLRGYHEETYIKDHSLTKKQAKKLKNSEQWGRSFQEENIEELLEMIKLCKENGVRPIIITLPLPQSIIWKTDGWDAFTDKMAELSSNYEFDYYDFNLLKNISKYFHDDKSWFDDEHMNINGSKVFSKILGKELKALNDGSPRAYKYYKSYAQAKKHSIYAK